MNDISARYLAQLVLDRVEGERAYANLALNEVLNRYVQLDPRERGFCTELVYGVLRHLYKIDFILGRLLSRPLSSLKLPVKNILRLAFYQLLFLTEIPDRAVCHMAVELTKQSKFSGLSGLVNGVLRNYLRRKGQIDLPNREKDPAGYLTIEYSHPQWLVERWLEHFGPAKTEQILSADNLPPPLTIRVNPLWGSIAKLKGALEAHGIVTEPGRFLPESLCIHNLPSGFETIPEFQEGAFFVQDESSMLVGHLINPQPRSLVLDLCAAPGGKSTHMAELMGDQGYIVSVDNHPHKIDLIAGNALRLGLRSIHAVLGNAENFQMDSGQQADCVLVDAPCSGTGVLRRRVDARYRRQPREIIELATVQRRILENAAVLVRPGGCLVYSTCTLEPEENQRQISGFLESHPGFEMADFRSYLPEAIQPFLAEADARWATVLPSPGAGDGFFMCRLEKGKE